MSDPVDPVTPQAAPQPTAPAPEPSPAGTYPLAQDNFTLRVSAPALGSVTFSSGRRDSGRVRDGFMPRPSELPQEALAHIRVVRKLANEILPWFLSAEELRKRPLYRAYAMYSWTRDTLAGLTGFGLSHPLAKAISGESTDITLALSQMPLWLAILTVVAAIMWVILKTFVSKDDGEKRAVLARSCRKEFMVLNLRLRNALQHRHPLHALVAIQQELTAIVDRHIAEGSWAFQNDVLAPGIAEKVRRRTAELVAQNISSWDQPSGEGEIEQPDEHHGGQS
jgi:hypothetical protein